MERQTEDQIANHIYEKIMDGLRKNGIFIMINETDKIKLKKSKSSKDNA